MIARIKQLFISLALALSMALPALAVQPDEILDDPVLEARAREISQQLRCVVCQNENIDSSNAGVARTMRLLLRERLQAGDSDEEVINFFVERYGNFVLFQPPFKQSTLLLWIGPALIFVLGLVAAWFAIKRKPKAAAAGVEITAEEEARIEALLKDTDPEGKS